MKFSLQKYGIWIVLAGLVYFPLFGHLSSLPLRIWDESRLAVNALEMLENGNIWVTYFDGMPDMWNTKPPLMIWLQALMMKLFGKDVLAVRLPAALAALGTVLILVFFAARYLQSRFVGFAAALVLITSKGYVCLHGTRTGDYDALLTFFVLGSALAYFLFLEKNNIRYLYLFFANLALACLTKGISGLFLLPALFIYTIYRKKLWSILSNKHTHSGIIGFLVIVFGYYFIREHFNPGYLKAVWENELGGRFLTVIEDHNAGFWFYFHNLISYRYTYWFIFALSGGLLGLFYRNKHINRFSSFALIVVLSLLLLISVAKTKLDWYDMPIYPFTALLVGIFIHYCFSLLQSVEKRQNILKKPILAYLFLAILFLKPYQEIIADTYKPQENSWDKEVFYVEYFFKDALRDKNDLNNYFILHTGYHAHILFYYKILREKGVNINFKDYKELLPNDLVIFHQKNVTEYLNEHYNYDIIAQKDNAIQAKINEPK
ncbi:MAG: glycosyltransferase family 39 protein [Chitinophagales bacterium]|nr:glycosyltransferase family 39 protein [Bacteroidota bacterium]